LWYWVRVLSHFCRMVRVQPQGSGLEKCGPGLTMTILSQLGLAGSQTSLASGAGEGDRTQGKPWLREKTPEDF
jgi:hypothetical protein